MATNHAVDATADRYRAADLVLFNGTVRSLDAAQTSTTAMAVRDGRVLAVDSDRELLALVGEQTRVLDLEGRAAVPGFIETHTHPTFFGMTLQAPVTPNGPSSDPTSAPADARPNA